MNAVMPTADPAAVMFAGDWHGHSEAARQTCRAAADENAPVVLQLGDFGVWPGREGALYRRAVSAAAVEADVDVLFIDGNHEAFPDLYDWPVDPATGLRPIAPRLWHVPRGTRWQWAGLRFAALGGATSLDRDDRIEGIDWWPEEAVTYADVQNVLDGGTADVLVSHDCPTGVLIPGIHHRQPSKYWRLDALEKAWDHRDVLASVTSGLQVTHVFHGHFHVGYTTLARIDGMNHPVRSTGLCDEGGDPRWRAVTVNLQELGSESAQLRASST
jgi:hypothetical protein